MTSFIQNAAIAFALVCTASVTKASTESGFKVSLVSDDNPAIIKHHDAVTNTKYTWNPDTKILIEMRPSTESAPGITLVWDFKAETVQSNREPIPFKEILEDHLKIRRDVVSLLELKLAAPPVSPGITLSAQPN